MLSFRLPPVFLSKVTCIATSHSSGVIVNSTFPLMDEVIQVQGMPEFIHQDCFKLIDNGGTHKHSCTSKPLSIQVPSQLFCLLLYVHFWSEKLKKRSKKWMKLWRNFFPPYVYLLMQSIKWRCKQINKKKAFFVTKFLLWECPGVPHGSFIYFHLMETY